MTPEHRRQLADLIQTSKEEIAEEWRKRVRPLLSARELSTPELTDQLPNFLDELAECIRDIDRHYSWVETVQTEHSVESMAAEHGKQRFRVGYDIVEIIKEYGILREVILDIANEHNVVVAGLGGRVFHFTFSQAVAAAAMSYQEEKEADLRHRRKEYLSFVMHDLKTPLNAITVAAEVLEDKLDDPKLVSEMNGIILRNAEKLDQLLTQTILVSKATEAEDTDRLAPRHIELWPVVQSVIEEFKIVASVDKTQVVNLVPPTCTIYADATALKSVLRNLLSNGMKYSAGGKIVIGVSTARKREVDIWVRDNGVGIPDERQKVLFQTLPPDPSHKNSTGVGLLIVKKIVEAHHGRVCIESKMGEGTTVRVTLPVVQASK